GPPAHRGGTSRGAAPRAASHKVDSNRAAVAAPSSRGEAGSAGSTPSSSAAPRPRVLIEEPARAKVLE
ncbi:MAG TPA: hypothetical protein VFS43_24220, partial [Polyangiaceae bacterium]|nr:hypothetical protein [Polyangiaceae bacterium]